MAPSSQGSVSIYLIKIQLESQPSVLKIIYEEAAEGQTWGETIGASLSTSRNFTFSSGKLCEGQKRRLNKHLLSPPDCGRGFMQISQHFGSDQESLTSMQATSPAGRRQPGAGNNSHSHTDITEPHTPLNRMWDGKAPENRDGPFSPGLCQSPHLRWLQVREGHLTF